MSKIPHLRPDNILFIFIDLQQKLLDRILDAKKIVQANSMLLKACRILKIPSIVTTQYRKGLGDLAAEFSAGVTQEVLDKTSFSCGGDPGIQTVLSAHRAQWVAVSGVETHICVMQTVLDLMREGGQVAVVSDAIGARGEEDHIRGLARMERAGALVVTREMLIYELIGRSDHEAFKQILPLIKS